MLTLYTVLADTTQDSLGCLPTLHWLTLYTPCRRYTRRSARCCRRYTTLPTVFVDATEDPLPLLSCLALQKSVVYLCSAGSQVMLAHTTQEFLRRHKCYTPLQCHVVALLRRRRVLPRGDTPHKTCTLQKSEKTLRFALPSGICQQASNICVV